MDNIKDHKVLIVDDILVNRVLLVEIVEEIGLDYLEANNGYEAIELLKNNDIALILLDIEMPRMNGFETIRHIRTKLQPPKSQIAIVAVTAHDPNTFFDEYQQVGFDHLITKPYTLEKLIRIINDLMKASPD